MKIKVGDLTVKQVHSICQVACIKCPLHCAIGDSDKITCMTNYQECDDCEVEISDEVAGMTK